MTTVPQSGAPQPAVLLGDLVEHAAQAWPDRTALVWEGHRRTFAQLRSAAHAAADAMQAHGVGRGDRVVVVLDDLLDSVAVQFGAALLGAIQVPAAPGTTPYAADYLLADAEPACVHGPADDTLARRAAQRGVPVLTLRPFEAGYGSAGGPAEPSPAAAHLSATGAAGTDRPAPGPRGAAAGVISQDPVSLFYTSGSTGRPKGVVSTHGNVLFAAAAIGRRLDLRQDDVIGCVLPLTFDYGAYQIFLGLLSGATVALGRGVDAGLLRFLVRHGVTVLPAVPGIAQMLHRLVRRGRGPLPPLRILTNTGSAMSEDLVRRVREQFPGLGVYLMFGLTECKRVSILTADELADRPGSVGRPLDDTAVLVVDPATQEVLPPHSPGEFVVRGPHVTRGYWRDPDRTALRFRPFGPVRETVLFTGDRGWLDADGYLYFEGRDDDLYKSGGFRVSATEVALAAEDIPAVDEAYCLPPVPSQGPCLAVVTALTAEQTRAELRERLEPFKIPDRIEVLDRLPLKPNGKTDTAALRARLGLLPAGPASVPVPASAPAQEEAR